MGDDVPPDEPAQHPLAGLLRDALAGRYPDPDGGWSRVPPWTEGVEAVIAFTGHAVLAVGDDVTDEELGRLGVDGYGGAHHPRVVSALLGSGWAECLDVLLLTTGTSASERFSLTPRPDLDTHPRVAHARRLRRDVVAYGLDAGDEVVVSLGLGVAGLPEVGVELAGDWRGRGGEVLTAVRRLVPAGEPLVAAVAPGNARALRAFLRSGFTPVGSLQVWRPAR